MAKTLIRYVVFSLVVACFSACVHPPAITTSGSPTAPTAGSLPPLSQRPVRLALVGQSNAVLGRPVFAQQTGILTLVPTAGDGPVIACWAVTSDCWTLLSPTIYRINIDAFVWWQGESDVDNPTYDVALADLVGRIRAVVGNPTLLIVLMQYGVAYSGHPGGSERQSQAWVASDAHALYVPTHDLEFREDGGHMTDEGYAAAARRIVAMVRQKLQ